MLIGAKFRLAVKLYRETVCIYIHAELLINIK